MLIRPNVDKELTNHASLKRLVFKVDRNDNIHMDPYRPAVKGNCRFKLKIIQESCRLIFLRNNCHKSLPHILLAPITDALPPSRSRLKHRVSVFTATEVRPSFPFPLLS